MHIDVRFDAQRVIDRMNAIPDQVVKPALPAAINKVLDKGRSGTVKEAAAQYNLKQKVIRGRTSIRKASVRLPEGRFYFGILPVRASDVGEPRKGRGGARVGGFSFPGGFVATMPSGHRGIFLRKQPGQRRTRGRSRTSSANLPIKEATVLLTGAENIARSNFRRAMEEFPRLFQHEVEWRMNNRRPR